MNTTSRIMIAGAAGIAVAAGAVAVGPGATAQTSVLNGTFSQLPAADTLGLNIRGAARVTLNDDGTFATMQVSGVDAAQQYAAHLHNAPCDAANPGGGHYQHVLGAGITPPNELWLSTTTSWSDGNSPNAGGVLHGTGSATWIADSRAVSVVIHGAKPTGFDPSGGPKLACADLR